MSKPVIVVPVKAQSERVVGKNFADLGGRPLYEWTFDTLSIFVPDYEVVVVTDLVMVQEAADEANLLVVSRKRWWDDLTAWEVALHATPAETIALCLVTCPFRRYEDVKNGLALFESDPGRSVISAVPVNWKSVLVHDEQYDHAQGLGYVDRAYVSTGVIQIAKREHIFEGCIDRRVPFNILEVDQTVGLDIDTPFDLECARAVVDRRRADV